MNRSETLPDRLRRLRQSASGLWTAEADAPDGAGVTGGLDDAAIRAAYARWAPVYDMVFRAPLYFGRRAGVKRLNELSGKILEAGVGTGMSLPHYGSHLEVTGIDLSEPMLARAEARVRGGELNNVAALLAMDAGNLAFPDATFDAVIAMYLLPVVPNPHRVMSELHRVTRPGGRVILVNHFSADSGPRALVENALERFADRLGWNPSFPKSQVLGHAGLQLVGEQNLPPFGLFTMMEFVRSGEGDDRPT